MYRPHAREALPLRPQVISLQMILMIMILHIGFCLLAAGGIFISL